jgi:hypothetical protein
VISALYSGYIAGVPQMYADADADADVITCAFCGSALSRSRTHWFAKHSVFLILNYVPQNRF